MASGAKEDMGESSCAESGGSLSQPPQAGPLEAAEDSWCPICLEYMKEPAYVTYCMHKFCFQCIWQWAMARDDCPVCRQPMEKLLYSVRGDRDYEEYKVSLLALAREMIAYEWGFQALTAETLQPVWVAHDQQPLAGRRGLLGTESAQRQDAALGPSNAPSQQAPTSSASYETAPPRAGECPAGPAAPLDPHNGTE
ncbi:putative E3 ubiquitin-protein ligase RING1a [Pipra filicauda]|uniref:RING-type E3 ubiquitin transferase n=1 Tax=Pipra filicauda TaxID=649802 RepID=A0A6J2ITZ6_9PASS|nr:putative E3 ubiquitin-protein ligase RING1a [Pipra filicauda]XP_039235221.1 putative E3 ubiquitin-protein ligase RING1a [Pipra filicauda]